MKKTYLLLGAALTTLSATAQSLTTVSGLRLYEHHSPLIAGSQGANGDQSGYDFVNRAYFHSYNKATMGAYTGNDTANIDLVEHNGPYGGTSTKRLFGFTSGVSAIWNGDIKGNRTTRWMEAPASFNYATAATVQQLKAAYDSTKAKQYVDTVKANTTYLGRIRNTNRYVALRTATVKNKTTTDANVYFDFEYKWGVLSTTAVTDPLAAVPLALYPNPAEDRVTVENPAVQPLALRVLGATGQTVRTLTVAPGQKAAIDLRGLAAGLYVIRGTTADGQGYAQSFLKD